MRSINMKKEVAGTVEELIPRLTENLKAEGFGVLTSIDMRAKIKEKLGKDIAPIVILGACNPQLAYEAYSMDPDVASLLPCNAVVRQAAPGRVSVELARPSALMQLVGDERLKALAETADDRLARVLDRLEPAIRIEG
ncbi:MAG: DUF302 domain-containing protein [Elusimicrobiota bacterium]|jgi:uncharacterized protein (DUF302 family)